MLKVWRESVDLDPWTLPGPYWQWHLILGRHFEQIHNCYIKVRCRKRTGLFCFFFFIWLPCISLFTLMLHDKISTARINRAGVPYWKWSAAPCMVGWDMKMSHGYERTNHVPLNGKCHTSEEEWQCKRRIHATWQDAKKKVMRKNALICDKHTGLCDNFIS